MTKVVPKQPEEDGFPGTLTDTQVTALKDFWRKIDEVVNPSEGEKAGDGGADGGDEDDLNTGGEEKSGKDAFKGVSKDDSEKERQRQEKEAAATRKLLKQISPKEFRYMIWISCQADNPDALILRFLRARSFNVDQAFSMLCASLQWRKSEDVPGLIRTGETGLGGWKDGLAGKGKDEKEGQRFLKQYEIGKSFAYGTTRDGSPVAYIRVDLHYVWQQKPLSLQRFVTHIVESGRMLLVAPAERVLLVLDMSKFGLSNMDYLVILFLLQFFSTYYPEAISNILVHKAPWVFNRIWGFLKPLIDGAIREKILFTKSAEDLLKYVDKTHLPENLGGEAIVKWDYPGPQGPAKSGPEKEKLEKAMDDLNLQYEDATRKWINSSDKTLGKDREILALKRFLLWRKLDPYLRAPTVFQAQKIVSEYALVKWTYKQKDGGELVEEMGKSNEEIEEEIKALESGHTGSNAPKKKSKKKDGKDDENKEAAEVGAGAGAGAAGAAAASKKTGKDHRANGKREIADSSEDATPAEKSHAQGAEKSTPEPETNSESEPEVGQTDHTSADKPLRPGRIVKETKDQLQDVYSALTVGVGRAHNEVEAHQK